MSHEGRAQCSVPETASAVLRDSECAAGTFPTRLVNRPARKPLDLTQRLALSALIASGKMIRRTDGFGTDTTTLISTELAAFLKVRHYAVPSFDGCTIYPTTKGKELNAETGHAGR